MVDGGVGSSAGEVEMPVIRTIETSYRRRMVCGELEFHSCEVAGGGGRGDARQGVREGVPETAHSVQNA